MFRVLLPELALGQGYDLICTTGGTGLSCVRFRDKGICCILGTDSYPGRRNDELVKVFSVAPLIAEELAAYLDIG